MASLEKGGRARVRPVIISGEITGKRHDVDTGDPSFLLSWTDPDGEAHERWFDPAELEPEPDTAPAAV